MTTITKTTAAAVSRKLSNLNFQKADDAGIGFAVFNTPDGYGFEIVVIHTGYAPSNASKELVEAGYVVRLAWTSFDEVTRRYRECFEIAGRVGA